ncbi:MAG: hypothetical protein KJ601_07710 [Nanoarchaeota archaeon]|nr:hypothetical protein [Nanoarchaeota archaeon]MBU1703808.1 hypothetical protein [Nanoarchaeota archaeon]
MKKKPRWLKYGLITAAIVLTLHLVLFGIASSCFKSCSSFECYGCGILLMPFLYYVRWSHINVGNILMANMVLGFMLITAFSFGIGAAAGLGVDKIKRLFHRNNRRRNTKKKS